MTDNQSSLDIASLNEKIERESETPEIYLQKFTCRNLHQILYTRFDPTLAPLQRLPPGKCQV